MSTCTALPTPTYGQSSNSLCVENCTNTGEYADPFHPNRLCATTCTTSPQTYSYLLTKMCLQTCPDLYFGDKYTQTPKGICRTGCSGIYYADPTTHLCVPTCPSGYFGHSSVTGQPCVKKCPTGYFGQNKTTNRVCVTSCDLGFWADNMTRLCTDVKAECSNDTYADYTQKKCVNVTSCSTTTYSDPLTKGCESVCSNSSYFGNSYNRTCVTLCP